MLSRLIRYAAVSVIPNNRNKFPPLNRFVSSSLISSTKTGKFDFVPSYFQIEACKTCATAVDLFETMLSQSYDSISDYNFILSSLLQSGWTRAVVSLAQQLEEKDVVPDIHTWTILIKCHCFHGNMSSAISLFNNIINTGHQPAPKTLNDIFYAFRRIGEIHKAILFYNHIVLEKGFQLDRPTYLSLIDGLCEIGETQIAIQLLRQALQIDRADDGGFSVNCLYNSIILRLCKDRLINQAYDLYSEMIHVNNIEPGPSTYHHLIYGYCILGQFKQAIALFEEFKASINTPPTPPTLVIVTERELKSTKSVVAVMIKAGVKPNVASYHSVVGELYKGGSQRVAQKVETLLLSKPSLQDPYHD